jgi:hypothetical protein
MPDDTTKKPSQSGKTDNAAKFVEELPQKPIADRDAQSVKGGRARRGGDDQPTE